MPSPRRVGPREVGPMTLRGLALLVLPAGALAIAAAIVLAPAPYSRAQDRDFDHFLTSFPLTGAHERVACESCHNRGQFEGTPKECSTCHGTGGVASSHKPQNHVPTSAPCADCHTTNHWFGARFDHAEISEAATAATTAPPLSASQLRTCRAPMHAATVTGP